MSNVKPVALSPKMQPHLQHGRHARTETAECMLGIAEIRDIEASDWKWFHSLFWISKACRGTTLLISLRRAKCCAYGSAKPVTE